MLKGLGDFITLAVIIKTYEPNVECIEPTGSIPQSIACYSGMELLPTSKDLEFFGTGDDVDIKLPTQFTEGETPR